MGGWHRGGRGVLLLLLLSPIACDRGSNGAVDAGGVNFGADAAIRREGGEGDARGSAGIPRLRDAGGPAFAGDASMPADSGLEQPNAALFDRERLLRVEIELPASDWNVIRSEGRGLNAVLSGCSEPVYPYTEFEALVRIDGTELQRVAVRKKGNFGSLSVYRPSLKLNFARHSAEQRYLGHKRLTLNNNRDDGANARQCLSYAVFRAAGVPAPRCSLARVFVNGEDLGVYSNVESIKKPFLRRHFEDPEGALYEGQSSDFSDGFLERFEFKGGGANTDALAAVQEALSAPDARLVQELEGVLDLDAFFSFWAAEVLVGHWEGYSGALNNFYLYQEPGHGFQFIPWGTDNAFRAHGYAEPDVIPQTVLAVGALTARLYEVEATRERYRERLGELLEDVWNEESLNAQLDVAQTLSGNGIDSADLEDLRQFVGFRRGVLTSELEGEAPVWPYAPPEPSRCVPAGTPITGAMEVSLGAADEWVDAPACLELEIDGEAVVFESLRVAAGASHLPQQTALAWLGTQSDGGLLLVQLFLPNASLLPGEYAFHGLETVGVVTALDDSDLPRTLGFIGDGRLVFEPQADAGASLHARFSGVFTPGELPRLPVQE